MKLNFKSGFLSGFIAALLVVPLALALGDFIKASVREFRGYGELCEINSSPPVEAQIAPVKERYHLTDFDGTNVYAPVYENVSKSTYDPDKLFTEGAYRYYRGGSGTSLVGIDVSRYQNGVDWIKVKNSGVDYAILRVAYRGYGSEGKIVPDEKFDAFASGANAAGMPIGVYFFSQAVTKEEALEEAEAVIEAIAPYRIDCPVVFDTELISGADGRANNVPVSELTEIADTFCKAVKKAGYEPMIYANERWLLLHLDLRKLTDYPLWLAAYRDNITFPYNIKMWQYTESGSVDGIEGGVDISICFPEEGE